MRLAGQNADDLSTAKKNGAHSINAIQYHCRSQSASLSVFAVDRLFAAWLCKVLGPAKMVAVTGIAVV